MKNQIKSLTEELKQVKWEKRFYLGLAFVSLFLFTFSMYLAIMSFQVMIGSIELHHPHPEWVEFALAIISAVFIFVTFVFFLKANQRHRWAREDEIKLNEALKKYQW